MTAPLEGAFADLAAIVGQLDPEEMWREVTAAACERSLYRYLEAAWPYFDPMPFCDSWHLQAVAEHLEAVSNGQIRRLLINIPPRHGKTNLVAIAWPTWTWAKRQDPAFPLHGPGVRFLCASYGANKAQQDAVTARRLIGTPWYQKLWGKRVEISKDRDNQEQYDTKAGGSRISTGIPESLGKGGVIRIIDDPHKTDEVESDLIRSATIRAYDEVWRTRSNAPMLGAEVIIMQRLSQIDLSAHVLEDGDWVHLMLPCEYDWQRHCVTVIGWQDPRGCGPDGETLPDDERRMHDGELLCPSRFGEEWVSREKERIGPFAWQGQYNQIPSPRGGGIIKDHWWQLWPNDRFPDFGTVVVSLDGAYTEKELNDPTGCTVWGAFPHPETGLPKLMLIDAWRDWMGIHELVQRVAQTCQKRKADILLIESKASGLSVAQEIRRLFVRHPWVTHMFTTKADKYERLLAIQPLFASQMIYAPDRDWAQMVIDEVSAFPRGKFRDLTDSVSQALLWMRKNGVALRKEEHEEAEFELRAYRKPVAPAYDV